MICAGRCRRWRPGGGGRSRSCGSAGGAGEDGQDGQPLAGPLVHPGLAAPAFLGPVDLGVADRARDRPLRPASGLLHGPLGDVEVERPDAHQFVLGVDPRAGDARPVARPGPVTLRLLVSRSSFHARATPAAGAACRCPGTGPRSWPRTGRPGTRADRVQAGVVQRGLPFLQVVHEQVADRLALQPVAVDEFLDGQLPLGQAERADGGRGVGGEDARGRAAAGRSRPSSGRRGRGPAAGCRPAPRSPRR